MQTDSPTTIPPRPEAVREVERLLNDLASSNPPRRDDAKRALQAMGSEAAIVLQFLLEPEIAIKKARRRPVHLITFLGLVSFIAVFSLTFSHFEAFPGIALLFLLVLFAAVCTALLISQDRPSKPVQVQIEALLVVDDKRILPTLFDLRLMAAGTPDDRKLAAVITRHFAALKPEDSALVSAAHRRRLNDSLQLAAGTDSEYFVAILKGLCQIGDHTSIPVVARLAEADPHAAVTRAVRECLPYLNARAAQQGHCLLRPASANEQASEILVRAAAEVKSDQSTLLLSANPPVDNGP